MQTIIILYFYYSLAVHGLKKGSMLSWFLSPKRLWSHYNAGKPALIFLILYFCIFTFFWTLPKACTSVDESIPRCKGFKALKAPTTYNTSVGLGAPSVKANANSIDGSNLVPTWAKYQCIHECSPDAKIYYKTWFGYDQQKFRAEVKQYSGFHKDASKVLGMLLGFYVATMMRRWWSQLAALPDVKLVAMTLNSLSNPDADPEKALKIKKTILRYCMLSYSLAMIQVEQHGERFNRFFSKLFSERTRDPLKTSMPMDKDLILPHEVFDSEERMITDWWVPINWACTLLRQNKDVVKDTKDVNAPLLKFQHGLAHVLEYAHNPLPSVAAQAVHFICWGYLFFGTFAAQHCQGNHAPYWIPISVSLSVSPFKIISYLDTYTQLG